MLKKTSAPTLNINIQIEYCPSIGSFRARRIRVRISHDEISSIAGSIQEFGWTNPILVGSENDIIAGHARLAAAAHGTCDFVI